MKPEDGAEEMERILALSDKEVEAELIEKFGSKKAVDEMVERIRKKTNALIEKTRLRYH